MTIRAESVAASYRRGQHVISGIDLTVAEGEFVLILGHNGAGKSTFLNTLFGIRPTDAGTIEVDGVPLAPGVASRLAAGVALVPAEHAIFPGLTVEENVLVAAAARRRSKSEFRAAVGRAMDTFPVLGPRAGELAGTLSGGQRRMLAIAMALTQTPRYLLMDEPSLGLAPQVVETLYETLASLRETTGVATVVVEQAVSPSILNADQIHVIQTGRQVFVGDAAEFAKQDLWELL